MNPVYPHRIRLRGPWSAELVSGGVRFRRRFGFPGRIDDFERVWLTFAGVPGAAEAWLNGVRLGPRPGGDFEHEITKLLRPRNEVVVEVQGDSCGAVALEIRRAAFLRGLHAEVTATELTVQGEAVGVSERPLELYVVCDRYSVAYEIVTPTPQGTPFRLTAVLPAASPVVAVKVDLVDGATIWYTWEHEFPNAQGNAARR
jgi:hypothetical protein